MAATINLDAYSDALVLLGTAGVVVPIVRRFRVNPVLAYLVAGAILGPLGLGQFKDILPVLYWVTVVDAKNVSLFAELGVVFLLFLIGLELSYERLLTMRRLVFGLGLTQVLLCGFIIGGVAASLAQLRPASAIIVGSCLALSSTAIVIEILSEQRRLSTTAGRTSFSILLAQDLAVVPILLFVSTVGADQGGSVVASVLMALLKALVAVALIAGVGRLVLRPLLRLVAGSQSTELFVAAILFVIVGMGVAAGVAGLSMALGAFIAGLMLAETEFRKAIETTVEPFKGLLLGLFFFTVGMGLDMRELAREPYWLFACVVGLILLKATLITGLARLYRISWPAAIETGLLLGPGGEFAFVGIGLAAALGVVREDVASFTLALTSITMALIPLMALIARRINERIAKSKPLDPVLSLLPPVDVKGRAIVVGHGRVGQIVCSMLEAHNFPFLATDRDPQAVASVRRQGAREVYYGDASNPAFLRSCGLMESAAVIVTIHDQAGIDEIVRVVRALRPDILIVSRARDATHARHLYKIGVTDAVPETIEASLQLSEAALVGLNLPAGLVIASIHEKRDEFRRELQEAAGQAGRGSSHALLAKTTG